MRSPRPSRAAPELVDLRLDNGARVIVQPLDARGTGAGAAAVQLWIGAGTSAERADEHGCAHLLEHMLFKKTAPVGQGRRARSIDLATALEDLGGDVNAFTSHDETVVHATVPADQAAAAIAVLAAATLGPALDPAALAQEREVVVEEIKQYDDDPGQRVFHHVMRRVHGTHSYGRPVLGLAREVRGHTAARLRAYHRRAYAGARVTLVVVGAVDVGAVMRAGRRALGGLPRATRLPDEAEPRPATKPRLHIHRGDVQEVTLMLGWSSAAAGTPEACAFDVAGVVLGHGEASRLVRETRRGAQVVSEVQCASETLRRAGALLISAHTTGPQVLDAVSAILAQVDRMRSEPISADELARARAILESDQVYRQETVQGRAHALGYFATAFGDLGREKVYYQSLAELTPERVRAACAGLATHRVSAAFELPQDGTTASTVTKLERLFAVPPTRPVKRPKKVLPDRHGILSVDLPSGLRVRARVDHTVPMAAGWLAWPGGQGSEPRALAGAAAATAGLLTRGNARFTGDAISRTVDGLAAGLDGFAGRNSLGLHWECLSRDVPQLLDLALECGRTPQFLASELAEERRVALQELAAEADDLGQLAIRAMLSELYGDHALSRPLRGTSTGLRALTGARLASLWAAEYPLARAVLGLVGDFDLESVLVRLGEMDLRTGRKGQVAKARPRARRPTLTGPRERELFKPREQAHIAVGFPALALGDPREPVMDVLNAVLGGQSGRLFTALRERQGLVYEVSVSAVAARDAGHVVVHASTGQDKLPRARAAIAAELARAVAEPPSPEELARAKAWLIGQHEIGQQRRSRVASQIAFSAAYGLSHARHFEYPARVAATTGAQVWSLARSILDPSRQVVGLVRAR